MSERNYATSADIDLEAIDRQDQLRRLRRATLAITVLACAAAALDAVAGVAAGDSPFSLTTALLMGGAVAAAAANRLATSGRAWASIVVISLDAATLAIYTAWQVNEIYAPLIVILGLSFALPYVTSAQLRPLAIGSLIVGVAGVTLAQNWEVGQPLARIAQRALLLGLILWLLWQFHQRLTHSLESARTANDELGAIRRSLEGEVAARTGELSAALDEVRGRAAEQQRMLDEIARQGQLIRELSLPVLPVAEDVLVMPLVGNLDGARLDMAMQEALTAVERRAVRFLILDITGVPVVDSHVAQKLVSVVQAVALLGTRSLLVGVRPEVAQTIVGLNLHIEGALPFSDLQAALRYALAGGGAA